jgi:hypothetical protein
VQEIISIILATAGILATLFGLLRGTEWAIEKASRFVEPRREQYSFLQAIPVIWTGLAALLLVLLVGTVIGVLLLRQGSDNGPNPVTASQPNWRLIGADDFRDQREGLFSFGETQTLISLTGDEFMTGYSYVNGAMVATLKTEASITAPRVHIGGGQAVSTLPVASNFAVEVSAGLLKSSIQSYECGIEYKTEEGNYRFAITPCDGQYHINLPLASMPGVIPPTSGRQAGPAGTYVWRPNAAVKTGVQNNLIRLQIVRDVMTVYVNGQLIDAVERPGLSLKSGTVKLVWAALGPFERGADIAIQFTGFKLYTLDE